MNVLYTKPMTSFRSIKTFAQRKKTYIGIGDKSIALMELSDKEFVHEINRTRRDFAEKYPQLTHLIFEYKKQCMLLDLDFWYERPVPERCERFVKMDIMTLMNNIDIDSKDGKEILQLCDELLKQYIKNYESLESL